MIAIGIAFETGRRSGSPSSETLAGHDPAVDAAKHFHVAGISMAPTCLPPHWRALCPTCDLRYPIDRKCDPAKARCYHCGGRLTDFREGLADVVRVVNTDAPLEVGDVVLIDRHLSEDDPPLPALKRVLAVGGQTVHCRGRDLVAVPANGMTRVWIPVDDDPHREHSRWTTVAGAEHPTVVYHHQSVHHDGLPSPIRDDHPFNASLARTLFPPSALRLTGRYVGDSKGPVTVAAWVTGRVCVTTRTLAAGQCFSWEMPESVNDGDRSLDDHAFTATQWLGPHTPLVIEGPVADRKVDQAIVYRLRPSDRDSIYPLTLGPDEVFVVGDNVAVSVDSRQYGPISRSEILGRWEPIHSDQDGRPRG